MLGQTVILNLSLCCFTTVHVVPVKTLFNLVLVQELTKLRFKAKIVSIGRFGLRNPKPFSPPVLKNTLLVKFSKCPTLAFPKPRRLYANLID